MVDTKSKQKRKFRKTDEKVAILKSHLVDKLPVSEVCERHGVQPSVYYGLQKQLYDNMGMALEVSTKAPDPRVSQLERENAFLKARLAKKDEVIAEVSAEYVALKKALGVL